MREVTVAGLPIWQFERLVKEPGVTHFVTTRHGGVSPAPYDTLNLSTSTRDAPENVARNRERLLAAIAVERSHIARCMQVHGSRVLRAPDEMSSGPDGRLREGDALVTGTRGVLLLLMMADCTPVFVYDLMRNVAGIAHAGWRGTVGRVVTRLVQRMSDEFGSEPGDLLAAIGPSIGPCCYEVGEDVIQAVRTELEGPDSLLAPHADADKAYFDLWRANQRQLLACGITESRIEVAQVCTRCNQRTFFSDRAQRPSGRFGAGIMLVS